MLGLVYICVSMVVSGHASKALAGKGRVCITTNCMCFVCIYMLYSVAFVKQYSYVRRAHNILPYIEEVQVVVFANSTL